ncbi:hypothetical protein ADL19_24505 [Streptomyces purpurogeneiscleroticus]|nr:hypothetical protein ADL19_24505 [Streptomyces purpurogeneiscleroticus]
MCVVGRATEAGADLKDACVRAALHDLGYAPSLVDRLKRAKAGHASARLKSNLSRIRVREIYIGIDVCGYTVEHYIRIGRLAVYGIVHARSRFRIKHAHCSNRLGEADQRTVQPQGVREPPVTFSIEVPENELMRLHLAFRRLADRVEAPEMSVLIWPA